MIIHTVKAGETVFKIARAHGISPMKIIENNSLSSPDKLSVGQQLLILSPTRTYTVRGGDTLSAIARRFGVKKSRLLANNPFLGGTDRTYPGELLAIRYETQKYGMGAVNGYIYRGLPTDRLVATLPYLTYATLGCGVSDGEEISFLFDDREYLSKIQEAGKTPLLRITLRSHEGFLENAERQKRFLSNISAIAKARGYHGITLAFYELAKQSPAEYEKFILAARRELLGLDLILFTETDANETEFMEDAADANILMYEKCHMNEIPSFEDGEKKAALRYATLGEGSRLFLDIPVFGYDNGLPIEYDEILKLAYKNKAEIKHDDEKMISYFDYNKYSFGKREPHRVTFESFENIKAKLDLVYELGLMGISIDIGRCPTHTLMMFHALFCPVDYSFSAFSDTGGAQ